MSQTTKSEGLSGTIGGRTETSFRFKPGFEEQLATITKWCAIAFLVTSFLAAVISPR
jgi:protein translocase SecG subunit